MLDLHTHITDAVFDADREGVLQQAGDADLTAVMAVGQTVPSVLCWRHIYFAHSLLG